MKECQPQPKFLTTNCSLSKNKPNLICSNLNLLSLKVKKIKYKCSLIFFFLETSKMFEDELEQENQNLSKKNGALSSEVEKIKEEYKAYKVFFLKKRKPFFFFYCNRSKQKKPHYKWKNKSRSCEEKKIMLKMK